MTISVLYDFDADRYVLMASDGRLRPAPAGPRLFRAEPWPEVKWQHETQEAAEADAGKVRVYLAGVKDGAGRAGR
jgi:hypothetical protein